MKTRRLTGLLLGLLILPGCATTTIHGRLRLPAELTGVVVDSAGVPGGAASVEKITNAVVYVDRISPGREPRRHKTADPVTVVQRRHRFVPRVITVVAGTTVRFENRDRTYHKLFSISRAKRFHSEPCAPRKSQDVTFDRPGVVRVFCEVDPKMDGFVFVVPSSTYAQPDSTGAFEIRGLPRGQYRVTAWHPTEGEISRKLDLKAREVAVKLRF